MWYSGPSLSQAPQDVVVAAQQITIPADCPQELTNEDLVDGIMDTVPETSQFTPGSRQALAPNKLVTGSNAFQSRSGLGTGRSGPGSGWTGVSWTRVKLS